MFLTFLGSSFFYVGFTNDAVIAGFSSFFVTIFLMFRCFLKVFTIFISFFVEFLWKMPENCYFSFFNNNEIMKFIISMKIFYLCFQN